MVTQARLHELFTYNDGKLRWKKHRHGVQVGSEAGNVRAADGYRRIIVDGKTYYAHHLAYIFQHGHDVPEIDHKDRRRDDESAKNLRAASHSENLKNRGKYHIKNRHGQ
jgi:HNH endonuclease